MIVMIMIQEKIVNNEGIFYIKRNLLYSTAGLRPSRNQDNSSAVHTVSYQPCQTNMGILVLKNQKEFQNIKKNK